MVTTGYSDAEIMSVATDTDFAIGLVAYNHAKTKSRERAANWVLNYNIAKARKEFDAQNHFSEDVEELPKLTDEAAEEQLKKVTAVLDWRNLLERKGGNGADAAKPKNTLENVILILKNEVAADVFKHNEFASQDIYGRNTPWGGVEGAELRNIDTVRIKTYIARRFRFEPSNDRIEEAVLKIADENKFHPVRDYLDALPEWDGTERVNHWMHEALEASGHEEYIRAVARKTLTAMVARVYQPGVKFDQVVILEGIQGVGKSTVVRSLASDAWFSDAKINISDKDGVLSMRAVWIVELGELGAMRKADVDELKEFISRREDRIRVPYGKRTEMFPRQCIFIGTTNAKDYLRDLTGNRRFWPIKVGECNFDWITENRDQLFAEAKLCYQLGEPLYLEDKETNALAQEEQGERVFTDELSSVIREFLSKPSKLMNVNAFSLRDLFEKGPLLDQKMDRANQMRVADCLRYLKYEKVRSRKDGPKVVLWKKGGGHT